MTPPIWKLSFIIFPTIAILHLHVSPYTKVEESFNIQATHDILEYGVPLSDASKKLNAYYDHMTFPGAVPRTFIGSLILACLAKPEIWFGEMTGASAQNHVRAVLGGLNATALAFFARAVSQAYGPTTAAWYVALQASQFHLWYYASRTLPNMFAFFFSTIALSLLLPSTSSSLGQSRRSKLALYLLTLATVIFRSELALLLGAHCLWLLRRTQTVDAVKAMFRHVYVPAIVPGFLIALVVTITVDSYLWQSSTPIWPEFSAFLSNVLPSEGQQGASAWGTQPFYWYLAAALPRLLMAQMAMIDFLFLQPSTWQDPKTTDSLFPSYIYMAIYSILPHKETRFMFPIVPSLTLVAAVTCNRLLINAHKSMLTKSLLYAAISATVLMACLSHFLLLPLSAANYPGGLALSRLHAYYAENWEHIPLKTSRSEVKVHLTNLALQTGVTRFLEQPTILENHRRAIAAIPSEETSYIESRPPLILPGDANHPALTVLPPQPVPSGSAQTYEDSSHAHWTYDKTENNTRFLEPVFWDQFDFAIVENPQLAIGAWEVVEEIRALGSIRMSSDNGHGKCKRFAGWGKPVQAILQPIYQGGKADIERSGTTALLYAMYPTPIAMVLEYIHDIAHDVLRCGHGLPRNIISFWPEIGFETKLYIMQKTGSGIKPNWKLHEEKSTQIAGLPEHAATEQEPLALDKVGPLVVNKDGTLSRLDNWEQMNQQERKKTVEYLKKRNMIRLEAAAE